MTEALPAPVTRQEMILEIKRELAYRRRLYPAWVQSGRLKLDRAERQIAVMEAVLALLSETDGPQAA